MPPRKAPGRPARLTRKHTALIREHRGLPHNKTSALLRAERAHTRVPSVACEGRGGCECGWGGRRARSREAAAPARRRRPARGEQQRYELIRTSPSQRLFCVLGPMLRLAVSLWSRGQCSMPSDRHPNPEVCTVTMPPRPSQVTLCKAVVLAAALRPTSLTSSGLAHSGFVGQRAGAERPVEPPARARARKLPLAFVCS